MRNALFVGFLLKFGATETFHHSQTKGNKVSENLNGNKKKIDKLFVIIQANQHCLLPVEVSLRSEAL